MKTKKEIVEQTQNAFDFIQKLYHEVSYLIKEIEGILAQENEEFVIVRPSGYGISNRTSTGLEANNVNYWLMKRLSVAFVPKDMTTTTNGQTDTQFQEGLKILYFNIHLDDKNLKEPVVYGGVLMDMEPKPSMKLPQKFEKLMGHFEYRRDRLFTSLKMNEYDDNTVKMKAEFIERNLYDLNNSEGIYEKLVKPILTIFRR